MRRLRRILTLGLATALIATSICLPVYADGGQNNFDINGDGYLDAYDANGDGIPEYADVDGDGYAEEPISVVGGDVPAGDDNPDMGVPVVEDVPAVDVPVIDNPVTPAVTPIPVLQPLPVPQEVINLKNYTLTNSLGYILSYSLDGGMTWSAGTSSNPVDLSAAQYQLAPGGTVSVKYVAENGSSFTDSPVQIITLSQASAPSGVYGVDPTTLGGQGTICGVDSTMEYANALLLGAPYNAISGGSVNVDAGSYYVRVATTGSCFFSDTVKVTVNPFKSNKEPTPNAVFDALSMILSNMSSGMEYCFDGMTWTHIADGSPTSKTLSDDDAKNALAHGIQIIKKGNGTTTTDSDIQTITIHKASAPNVIQGVAPTDNGNTGKIINVDTSMQYKANGAASWIDIGSNVVTNLAPGTYLVRVRASGVTIASDSVSVNIGAYRPTVLPKEHTPGTDFNAQNMVLSDIIGTKYSLDGGNNWTYAQDYNHIQLHDGQVSKDKGIKAYRPGNGTTTSDSDVQTISLSKANPPSGLSAVSATSTSLGAINGLQTNMEYGPKGGTWTAATANAVLLPAGVYYVRTRGAYTTLPSDPVEIDIHTASTPVMVTPIQATVAPTATPTPQKTDTGTQKKDTETQKKDDTSANKELTQEEVTEEIKAEETTQNTEETTPIPVPAAGEPNIASDESISGWSAIELSVTADPVVVNMNGSTEVPASVLKAVKAAGSELVIGMENNIIWTIPGSAISEDVTDVNLGIIEDTASIPQEAIDTVAKNSIATKQFEVEYDGAFGFKATLAMTLDRTNAGKYANLFCYQGAGQPMEYIDSSEIDTIGGASFGMVHASSYVIVVSDEKYSEATVDGSEAVKTKSSESKTAWILLIVLFISIVIIAVCVTVVMKKRQQDLRNQHRQNHRK